MWYQYVNVVVIRRCTISYVRSIRKPLTHLFSCPVSCRFLAILLSATDCRYNNSLQFSPYVTATSIGEMLRILNISFIVSQTTRHTSPRTQQSSSRPSSECMHHHHHNHHIWRTKCVRAPVMHIKLRARCPSVYTQNMAWMVAPRPLYTRLIRAFRFGTTGSLHFVCTVYVRTIRKHTRICFWKYICVAATVVCMFMVMVWCFALIQSRNDTTIATAAAALSSSLLGKSWAYGFSIDWYLKRFVILMYACRMYRLDGARTPYSTLCGKCITQLCFVQQTNELCVVPNISLAQLFDLFGSVGSACRPAAGQHITNESVRVSKTHMDGYLNTFTIYTTHFRLHYNPITFPPRELIVSLIDCLFCICTWL